MANEDDKDDGAPDEMAPMTKEQSDFLDRNVSYLELVRMIEPLRASTHTLVSTMIDTLASIREASPDGVLNDHGLAAWKKLGTVFDHLETLTKRLDNIFEGKPTWMAHTEEASDE
ncbi:hypothetical protein [Pseudomonas putida]